MYLDATTGARPVSGRSNVRLVFNPPTFHTLDISDVAAAGDGPRSG